MLINSLFKFVGKCSGNSLFIISFKEKARNDLEKFARDFPLLAQNYCRLMFFDEIDEEQ